MDTREDGLAPQVDALAAKPDNLSSNPVNHLAEDENSLLKVVLQHLHACLCGQLPQAPAATSSPPGRTVALNQEPLFLEWLFSALTLSQQMHQPCPCCLQT